jgi:large subunit ribosomal protein L25
MVDHLDLSVSNLDLGQTNRVKNIIVPKGVELMMSPSIPVALVEIPRALRSAQAEEKKGKK